VESGKVNQRRAIRFPQLDVWPYAQASLRNACARELERSTAMPFS
jgi:hypothetical protein